MTINDDDSSNKPKVEVKDTTKSVEEDATTLSLTVELDKASGADDDGELCDGERDGERRDRGVRTIHGEDCGFGDDRCG